MKEIETVDDYLAEQPPEARRVLERIRKAITDAAPGAEETISYQIPLYKLGGEHLVGFGGRPGGLSRSHRTRLDQLRVLPGGDSPGRSTRRLWIRGRGGADDEGLRSANTLS